jgi:GDP-mannose 6-dehydrogenase
MVHMRIAVFGLGYVGCVTAACLAARGHSVIGVDVASNKVEMLNAGNSPVFEEGLGELIADGIAGGALRATTDAAEAVLNSDLSLVCVGTPSNTNGSLRLAFVERVAVDIGRALQGKTEYHLVVFRSTVLPGTVEEILVPILTRASGRTRGVDFDVAFHPEFLREGSGILDFEHPPKIVIGVNDSACGSLLTCIYEGLEAPVIRTSIRVAEAVKYVDNVFHALKVSFANEIGNVCKALSVDSHEVMQIFCADRQLNISPAYLLPGAAFGGSCLPKDLRAFVYEARSHDVQVPLLEAIGHSNDRQKSRALGLVLDTGKKRIGMLGLSFKAGSDDLRESPAVELVKGLIGEGCLVAIYDPNVYLAKLFGANEAYIERELPHVAVLIRDTLQEVLDESDVIVVTNRSPDFSRIAETLRDGQILIDLVGLPSVATSHGEYVGISW